MRTRLEADDLLGLSELSGQLHREILSIARHETATRLIDALQVQKVRYQYRTVLVPGRAVSSLAEHRAIVAVIEASQSEEAEKLIFQHLSHVVRALGQVARAHAR
jgi:DNA-binding GntR family transcriptional regulator